MKDFFISHGVSEEGWNNLPEEDKIEWVLKASKIIETYVNDSAFEETQVAKYASPISKEELCITFKQEIVCKSALFVSKKKYGYHVVCDDGDMVDKIDVTGLEIIRSETPLMFKEGLIELLSLILKNAPDDDIKEAHDRWRASFKETYPEEIAENKGIKGIIKYTNEDGSLKKKCPYHVKAAVSFNMLMDEFGLEHKYPKIYDDTKNKLVYVKKNKYGVKAVMFDRWPQEFEEHGIYPCFKTMVNKFFTNKVEFLLKPVGKEKIIKDQNHKLFFG